MVAKKLRVGLVSSAVKQDIDTASITSDKTTDNSNRTATFDRGVVNNTRDFASAHDAPTIGSAATSNAWKQ